MLHVTLDSSVDVSFKRSNAITHQELEILSNDACNSSRKIGDYSYDS